jgi:hypothetical protein
LSVIVDVDVHAIGDRALRQQVELEVEGGLEGALALKTRREELHRTAAVVPNLFALGLEPRVQPQIELLEAGR